MSVIAILRQLSLARLAAATNFEETQIHCIPDWGRKPPCKKINWTGLVHGANVALVWRWLLLSQWLSYLWRFV
jgi:hypothetical protein